jgi:hypothetical protein
MTIDALPLIFEGGISKYTRPHVENLFEHSGPTLLVELFFRMSISMARIKQYRQYKTSSNLQNGRHHLMFLPDRMVMQFWEHGIFMSNFRHQKNNVFIATTEFVPKNGNIKVGWVVYDLVQLRIPQFFQLIGIPFILLLQENSSGPILLL